jgi:PAS domain S-box-containing protein
MTQIDSRRSELPRGKRAKASDPNAQVVAQVPDDPVTVALRESEARFRLLADSAPVMIWMSGPDKGCNYFNKPWLDFTGRPLEREMGNGWSEGVHADDLKRCFDIYTRAFESRQPFRMEYRLRRFDGQYRWVLDTGAPRISADGTFEGYIGSALDITDEKRVEEESRSLREQLTQIGRVTLMGELAASIAHEVNQPLCAIVSNAEAIQRMLTEGGFILEELLEALQDIAQDSQRASAVVGSIRKFLQKSTPEPSTVDVNEIIREVGVLAQREMVRRGVAVKLELAESLPAIVGDRVQLQQVILNLITNAAEAMLSIPRDSRHITISSRADESGNVAIAVSDTGTGLEPASAHKIFQPFFTTKPNGLGMGLAICRSIVEAHGGEIWADSNIGEGSIFRFTLPAIREVVS